MLSTRRLLGYLITIQRSQRSITTKLAVSTKMDKFELPQRYAGTCNSMWVEFTQLALEYKPLDLGTSFPDFFPPEYLTDELASISKGTDLRLHQYTRSYGHPRLVTALSNLYSRLMRRNINPQTEILVTFGAYQALFACINGHIDAGDEVIVSDPSFSTYVPMIKIAGGIPKSIPFRLRETSGCVTSADWVLDVTALEDSFNAKTKMIIVNNPHNPLGRVLSLEELTIIAELCKQWNVLCLSDEVYEWLVYKPNEHIRIASLPDMWERTITIGSGGKTFSVTGWQTGWAYGPANLIKNAQVVHQNSVYTCATPIQEAIAIGFETEIPELYRDHCYLVSLANTLQGKRNYMAKFLSDVGMIPILPQSGSFVVADWTPLENDIDLSKETDQYKDYRFIKWMTKNVGLLGIPMSAFYSCEHKHLGENLARYCFVKTDEKLQKAADILQKWKEK